MELDAGWLVASAVDATGLEDFGGDTFGEGLTRLTRSLDQEAELTDAGRHLLGSRLRQLLVNRLRIEAVFADHPEIAEQPVEAPLFIIGLPRTGTTALSQLVASDPQIRSLRLWESSEPVPPPESASEHDDPRIASAQRGLDAMYAAFPRMASLYFQTATDPTECQDLLGMEFRTSHFDGMAHVPAYTEWVLGCDMLPAYGYHLRTLQLLQWRCPPRLWHLKTPVHALSLDALDTVYPDARFLWTHRDPAEVLGSVCDLIAFTRSWVSDRDDAAEIGEQQAALGALAMERAMAFRDRVGEGRFADIGFDKLDTDPVGTVARAYGRLGLTLGSEGRARLEAWAADHHRGEHGVHRSSAAEFGLQPGAVRARFQTYVDRFGLSKVLR